MGQSKNAIFDPTLLDSGIKPVNTTQLLQIAATDEFRYRNETGLA